MRYTRHLLPGEKDKWLNLEVTLGPDEAWIDNKVRQFGTFLKTFDSQEKQSFKDMSGLADADIENFTVHDRPSLIALLLKLFIDRIGVHIIAEAEPNLGREPKNIFLGLAERLYRNDDYPVNIYIHSIYRKRGTPKTWLTLGSNADLDSTSQLLSNRVKNIVTYVNHNMVADRRYRANAQIDEQHIFVITKYTGPRVALSLTKNIEIPSASHTFIVFNRRTRQIGVVSGAHKEIGHIHYYLRYRLFPNQLAPRRNEQMLDGNTVVHSLIEQPDPDDGLVLKLLEVRNANLPDSPNLKLSSPTNESIYQAVDQLRAAWEHAQLSDLKNIEYYFLQRTLGLYARYDTWDRVIINTRSASTTNQVEDIFLERVTGRLNGINIKTTRLILSPYSPSYLLEKLLGQKLVSVDPAIPKEAEETLLNLIQKKLVKQRENFVKRLCFACFTPSWQGMTCPTCGSSDMRIVGEYMSLELIEQQFIKQLNNSIAGQIGQMVSYVKRRQRKNNQKHLIAVNSATKHSTVFVVYVSGKKDIEFLDDLTNEGFGAVAVLDPKMDTAKDQLTTIGVDTISLIRLLQHMLYPVADEPHPLIAALEAQHQQMLQRIIRRSRESLHRIQTKPQVYLPSTFEIDLKNLVQLLVPDVVRLGTEHSGKEVPDGYLRYGLQNYTTARRGRLFGWDAKYSQSATYQLDSADLRKQKGYIDWLMDPKGTPHQFGGLGIYAIISNFSRRDQFDTVLTGLASYRKLPKTTRIVVIEDLFIAKAIEWALANWQQVLVNNAAISRAVFSFVRRKQSKPYTVTSIDDWPRLERRLNLIITQ